jgi:hypothetical protein
VPGDGFVATLRRVEASESFLAHFGSMPWLERFTPDDQIGALVPLGARRMSGLHEITLTDANGIERECLAEAFTQTYQVFVLIHPIHALTRSSIVAPR